MHKRTPVKPRLEPDGPNPLGPHGPQGGRTGLCPRCSPNIYLSSRPRATEHRLRPPFAAVQPSRTRRFSTLDQCGPPGVAARPRDSAVTACLRSRITRTPSPTLGQRRATARSRPQRRALVVRREQSPSATRLALSHDPICLPASRNAHREVDVSLPASRSAERPFQAPCRQAEMPDHPPKFLAGKQLCPLRRCASLAGKRFMAPRTSELLAGKDSETRRGQKFLAGKQLCRSIAEVPCRQGPTAEWRVLGPSPPRARPPRAV